MWGVYIYTETEMGYDSWPVLKWNIDYDISPHASTAYLPLAILDARTPGTCPNLCMINSRVRLCYPL